MVRRKRKYRVMRSIFLRYIHQECCVTCSKLVRHHPQYAPQSIYWHAKKLVGEKIITIIIFIFNQDTHTTVVLFSVVYMIKGGKIKEDRVNCLQDTKEV